MQSLVASGHGKICQLPNYCLGNKAGSGTRSSTTLNKPKKSLILQGEAVWTKLKGKPPKVFLPRGSDVNASLKNSYF